MAKYIYLGRNLHISIPQIIVNIWCQYVSVFSWNQRISHNYTYIAYIYIYIHFVLYPNPWLQTVYFLLCGIKLHTYRWYPAKRALPAILTHGRYGPLLGYPRYLMPCTCDQLTSVFECRWHPFQFNLKDNGKYTIRLYQSNVWNWFSIRTLFTSSISNIC